MIGRGCIRISLGGHGNGSELQLVLPGLVHESLTPHLLGIEGGHVGSGGGGVQRGGAVVGRTKAAKIAETSDLAKAGALLYRFGCGCWLDHFLDLGPVSAHVLEFTGNLLQSGRTSDQNRSLGQFLRLLRRCTALAAAGRRAAAIGAGEAYTRVNLAAVSLDQGYFGCWLESSQVGDLDAFGENVVCGHQVEIESVTDSRPSVFFCTLPALLHEVDEDLGTALLDSLDVFEEAISLVLEDGGGQLGCRLGGVDGWVEGVEHGNTVVLVEWSQGEFVDQDLLWLLVLLVMADFSRD